MSGPKRMAGFFFALMIFVSVSAMAQTGMIPIYFHDYGNEFYHSDGSPIYPEVDNILRENSLIYHENRSIPGDAYHLPPGMDVIKVHYFGFGAQNYQDVPAYMDPDKTIKETEENFYHSADPSTLVGWGTGSGFELRWTRDRRFVSGADYASLDSVWVPGDVSGYIVTRYEATGDSTEYFTTNTSFSLPDAVAGSSYNFALKSVSASGDTFAFTMNPVQVFNVDDGAPHFWAEKTDYQERIYQGDIQSFDWPIRIYVDRVIDISDVTLEIVKASDPGTYSFSDTTSLNFDSSQGLIWADVPFTLTKMNGYGGFVFRLKYDDSTVSVTYPEETPLGKQFVWSSINNRVFGIDWNNYMMNPEKPKWRETVLPIINNIHNGISIDGNTVSYDAVFFDTVMGVSQAHNVIRPYDYGGDGAYLDSTVSAINYFDNGSDVGIFINSTSMALFQDLKAEQDSGRAQNFLGAMDENFTHNLNGIKETADLLWLFKRHPSWANIMFTSGIHTQDDRTQVLFTYLLSRDPSLATSPAPDYFGMEFSTEFPVILPEQLIRFGDSLSDPFATTEWPDYGIYRPKTSSKDSIRVWFSNNTSLMAPGTDCATFNYWVEDGIPGNTTEVLGVWHLGPGSGAGQVTLNDLVGNKSGGEWYRAEFDTVTHAVTDGAEFWTIPTGLNDPIPFTNTHSDSVPSQALYFSQPVRSPWFSPIAEYSIPQEAAAGDSSTITVKATHWTGASLDSLRIDCTDLGWDGWKYLSDANGDSLYSWKDAGVTVDVGLKELPAVATGKDGLKKYGTVKAYVSGPLAVHFVNLSSETGDLEVADGISTFTPLGGTRLDFDDNGDEDLLLVHGQSTGTLFQHYAQSANGAPEFNASLSIGQAHLPPAGSAGVSTGYVGIQSDGNQAIFVADGYQALPDSTFSPSLEDSSKIYVVESSASIVPDGDLLDYAPVGAYGSAWGDYNNDGLLDIIVGLAPTPPDGSYSGEVTTSGSGQPLLGGSAPLLYKQVHDPSTDEYSFELMLSHILPTTYHYSFEVMWCDVNGDQLLDIFVCDLLPTNSGTLYINQGPRTTAPDVGSYHFADETTSWFPAGHMPNGVKSAAFLDFNQDGHTDLVTCSWGQDDNLTMYEGDGSSFSYSQRDTVKVPKMPLSKNGLSVADFDGNGLDDILVLPYYDFDRPEVLLNGGGPPGSSNLVVGEFFRYEDLDLFPGRSNVSVIADWDDNRLQDIFLGRPETDGEFFFKNNPVQGVPQEKWVGIKLVGGDGQNPLGLGAYVEPVNTLLGNRKLLLSNGGATSVPPGVVFPLAAYAADTVSVKVTWPSGHVQVALCDVDDYNLIEDNSYEIVPGSVTSNYVPIPSGGTDWIFEWVTIGPAPRERDVVHLIGTTDTNSPCYCGGILDLYADMSSVSLTVTKESNGWRHKLTWENGCCAVTIPPCTTTYDVTSGNFLGSETSAGHVFKKMKICGSGF